MTCKVSTSTIDHFIVSNRVFNKCCSGGVTHSVDNTSNHSVINMSLEMNTFVPHNVECEKTVTSKIAWYKASSHINININSKLPDVILVKIPEIVETLHATVKIINQSWMLTLNH